MTIAEAKRILSALFDAVDHVNMLHIAASGESFLHKNLPGLIDACFEYESRFDRFMLFTNSTIIPSPALLERFSKYADKLIVQASKYGIDHEREKKIADMIIKSGCKLKPEIYYGPNQSFGGWINFGPWEPHDRTEEELEALFRNCYITSCMSGNWRSRDGKVFYCSRSQRGFDLGLIKDYEPECIDLFNGESREAMRAKFIEIANAPYLAACKSCNCKFGVGDEGNRILVDVNSKQKGGG